MDFQWQGPRGASYNVFGFRAETARTDSALVSLPKTAAAIGFLGLPDRLLSSFRFNRTSNPRTPREPVVGDFRDAYRVCRSGVIARFTFGINDIVALGI